MTASRKTVAHDDDRLLTRDEVAALFGVEPVTVTRWATSGRIGSIRTPGWHRRYRESEVQAILEASIENPLLGDDA